MSRYIDAELLLEDNTYEWFDDWGNYTGAGLAVVDAPTADVVEVVRCKDCESYNGHRWCNYLAESMLDNDYCSYGKKVE